MVTINRIESRIVGTINGHPFSCQYSEPKWKALKELEEKANTAATMVELKLIIDEITPMTKDSYKELTETATPHLVVNEATNQFYLKNGQYISNIPLPGVFAEKLMTSLDKGIDIEPLVKAWARFLRPIPGRPAYSKERGENFAYYISALYTNESKVSELMEKEGLSFEKAQELSTTTQVAITKEGLIVCYKVSEELTTKWALDENNQKIKVPRCAKTIDPDTGLVSEATPEFVEERVFEPAIQRTSGDAFFCTDLTGTGKEGHLIKVGHVHYLDSWDKVSKPGCKGLHCGGLSYIKGYQTGTRVTHNIFVDPSDIHTVYTGGDGVMTVKRYFVHSSFAGPNKNIYHSSEYAKMTDAEYSNLLTQAISVDIDGQVRKLEEMKQNAQMLLN